MRLPAQNPPIQMAFDNTFRTPKSKDRAGISPSGDDDCCWLVWDPFFWGICCIDASITGRYDKCC